MRSVKREEYTYHGRRVILDACELSPGTYEMNSADWAMRPSAIARWIDKEGI